MNKDLILSLAQRLKAISTELENEIIGSTGSFDMSDEDYNHILDFTLTEYYNDDDHGTREKNN